MAEILGGVMNIIKSGMIVMSRKIKKLFPQKEHHAHHDNHHH